MDDVDDPVPAGRVGIGVGHLDDSGAFLVDTAKDELPRRFSGRKGCGAAVGCCPACSLTG